MKLREVTFPKFLRGRVWTQIYLIPKPTRSYDFHGYFLSSFVWVFNLHSQIIHSWKHSLILSIFSSRFFQKAGWPSGNWESLSRNPSPGQASSPGLLRLPSSGHNSSLAQVSLRQSCASDSGPTPVGSPLLTAEMPWHGWMEASLTVHGFDSIP